MVNQDHHIDSLTVVADAAMLSFGNITQLEQAGLSYIVAARMAGLPKHHLEEVSQELNEVEGRYSDRQTKYGRLICDYSNKRASKNRSDRKKQLEKARQYLASGWSIRVVKEAIWEVVDILLFDQISGQTFTKRQVLPEEDQVIQWFKKLKSDAY